MASLVLRRSFSMSAVAQQLVKAPIQVHGIEGRYAAALYSAAFKQKKLDMVDKDFKTLQELYKTNPKFREFVKDPTLKRLSKKNTIEVCAQKLGVTKEVENFLVLMAENGRLGKLEAVLNAFDAIMRAHRGELFVQVTTAEPLSKAHEQSLNEALQKFAKPGQKLHISMVVNAQILGGMIVNVGDRYVDMSIASRIKKYEQALRAAV